MNKVWISFSLASHINKIKRLVGIQSQSHPVTSCTAVVREVLYQPNRNIMTSNPQPTTIRLKDIAILNRRNCKIKNPDKVEQILNEIIKGGSNELQVVTDFDFTLTKQKTTDGKPVLSSFGMFNKCKSLPRTFLTESKKLYEKYRNIEICPKIPQEEKRKHMIDWWNLSGDLLK